VKLNSYSWIGEIYEILILEAIFPTRF